MLDELAIDLQDVTKDYRGRRGAFRALDGISLRVRRGEIFGLLGPNGAGKSTLVKMMMTVIRPTRAVGTVLGRPIGHKPTLARVGYLPEHHRFPPYLTGRQALHFFGALSKVERPRRRRRVDQLLEIVGMAADADRKVSTYSKGMMQRVGLAQALVADPDLVVLDEPTDGVDPIGRRDIRDVLLALRDRGKSVFLNSHLLSELEMVCDRVAILVGGRVAKQGTMDELTLARQRYEIEVAAELQLDAGPAVSQRLRAAVTGLVRWDEGPGDKGTLGGRWPVQGGGPVLRVATGDAADVQGLLDAVRAAGLVVRRVQSLRPSLEELFMDALGQGGGRPPPPPPAVGSIPPRLGPDSKS